MRAHGAHHFSNTNFLCPIRRTRCGKVHEINASNNEDEQRDRPKKIDISYVTVRSKLRGSVRMKMNVSKRHQCVCENISGALEFLHCKVVPQHTHQLWTEV